LVEEAKVVLEEKSDICDAILPHRQPFYPEAERPAGIFFAVYTNGVEDIRVNHSAAAHLRPALFAAFIFQKQIDLGAWLGKWKEARPKPCQSVLPVLSLSKESVADFFFRGTNILFYFSQNAGRISELGD